MVEAPVKGTGALQHGSRASGGESFGETDCGSITSLMLDLATKWERTSTHGVAG